MSEEDSVPMLSHRAQRMQLAMADLVAREQEQHGAESAANALRRTVAASIRLREVAKVEAQARETGLEPDGMRPRDRTAGSQARTALRTAATKLRDPHNDVGGLVTTRSLVEAIESAEAIASRRSTAIEDAFVSYVRDHQPSGLTDVVTDGLEPVSLAVRFMRLRNALSIDSGVHMQDVIDKMRDFNAALSEWDELQPELAEAQRRMEPAIKEFLRAVRTGVSWSFITPEIRAWLDQEGNGALFKVVRREEF